MKDRDEKIMNYFFSIGFILLIALILAVFVVMSRFVLSDVNPIGAHVKETKDLLSDVSQVEAAAVKNIGEANVSIIQGKEAQVIELNNLPAKISDISFINVNPQKTILTLFLDHNIGMEDGMYYLKIGNKSELKKNDVLVYPTFEGLENGVLVAFDDDGILVLRVNDNKLERIPQSEVLGKVFYKE